ncbi:hypothetical protein I6N96_11445 [Enterococcus sp. BWM-S5]|uniref:Uncharacterized protein n=1 Tax=Enterococcus larvae TaxID=2794352 RepID=A0ABS4CL21_9ENTE|nr:hypothetical protein [Enterococcus larvae]MBP1046883.1 hypothetical protein [Enterococcus larvae]
MSFTTLGQDSLQSIRSKQILLARQCSDLILYHREQLTHEAGMLEECSYCKQFTAMQNEFSINTSRIQQIITLRKEEEAQR